MTKRQLLEALGPFTDDQYIYVACHKASGPFPVERLLIQGIQSVAAAHPGKPDLIGLVVHEQNKDLSKSPNR